VATLCEQLGRSKVIERGYRGDSRAEYSSKDGREWSDYAGPPPLRHCSEPRSFPGGLQQRGGGRWMVRCGANAATEGRRFFPPFKEIITIARFSLLLFISARRENTGNFIVSARHTPVTIPAHRSAPFFHLLASPVSSTRSTEWSSRRSSSLRGSRSPRSVSVL
jgi:hypothetical protein